jgi:hypothetical protein
MSELKSKFQRVMLIDDDTIDLYVTARLMTKYNLRENCRIYFCHKSIGLFTG